ncbi:MAG TPA: hypothetical protein VHJ76_00990 [Actinomycetota bacterium]|nr:hypothetical protein [Actinomycetota bacterium]
MKKLIAIAAVVAALTPLTAGPASAQVSGNVAFNCTAKLSAFPSVSGSGRCEGGARIGASGWGCVAGFRTPPVPPDFYLICGRGLNTFSATFTYNEQCVAGEPPVVGSAEGTATISDLLAVYNGTVTTANATLDFIWTRAGATAAIQITGGTINFGNGESVSGTLGVGEAAFAPLLTQDNLCPEGGPLEAEVVGSAQIAI